MATTWTERTVPTTTWTESSPSSDTWNEDFYGWFGGCGWFISLWFCAPDATTWIESSPP